jgi:hypothetical protein
MKQSTLLKWNYFWLGAGISAFIIGVLKLIVGIK